MNPRTYFVPVPKSDSKGRGAIRYVPLSNGRHVRVDTFVIPLAELNVRVGDTIRLCFHADSPHPALTLNSTNTSHQYSHQIPRSDYHNYTLTQPRQRTPAPKPLQP